MASSVVIIRTECSECGALWSDHPTVYLEKGWTSHCVDGRAVKVSYIMADDLLERIQKVIDASEFLCVPLQEIEDIVKEYKR